MCVNKGIMFKFSCNFWNFKIICPLMTLLFHTLLETSQDASCATSRVIENLIIDTQRQQFIRNYAIKYKNAHFMKNAVKTFLIIIRSV